MTSAVSPMQSEPRLLVCDRCGAREMTTGHQLDRVDMGWAVVRDSRGEEPSYYCPLCWVFDDDGWVSARGVSDE